MASYNDKKDYKFDTSTKLAKAYTEHNQTKPFVNASFNEGILNLL